MLPNYVKILKNKFSSSLGLPFQELLPESKIESVLKELKIKYRQRLFSPMVTLWAFLSQVLDADKSCHNTVSRIIAWLSAENLPIPSEDNSGYCQARQRLPQQLVQQLFTRVGQELEAKVSTKYLWCGRHVKVIDGSTVSMPDTALNQADFPQSSSQATGCGFPTASIGALFSLATGAAVGLIIDVLNTNDLKLARRLYKFLNPGDVLLGDRAFCAYADIILLQKQQVDVVFRKHLGRTNQLKSLAGKCVSSSERLLVWHKPKTRPQTLSSSEFALLPSSIVLREVHYSIANPGFRTQQVTLITTLLDSLAYPTSELVKLYQLRWDVELNLRHLKTTLGMDVLRGKTPDMVQKEIYVYLLAYNLLRTLMWSAGTTYGVPPLRLSLQGTRQHLNNFIIHLAATSAVHRERLYQKLLKIIVHKPMTERAGRSEPRVRKRRPKAYPLMRQPRLLMKKSLPV